MKKLPCYIAFVLIQFICLVFFPSESRSRDNTGESNINPVLKTNIETSDYISKIKHSNPEMAEFNGLVRYTIEKRGFTPLINYVFFHEGESDIHFRYKLFYEPETAKTFTDTTIAGNSIEIYHHILNIIGYRLKKYPDAEITLVGTNDGISTTEKNNLELSKNRAISVKEYFTGIWGIDPSRISTGHRGLPTHPTSTRTDSIGIEENRRVEILCDDWEIMKPVVQNFSLNEPQPHFMQFVLENGVPENEIRTRKIEIMAGGKIWNTISGIEGNPVKWDWKNDEGKFPETGQPFKARLVVTTNSGDEFVSEPVEIPVKFVRQDYYGSLSTKVERYYLVQIPFEHFLLDENSAHKMILKEYIFPGIFPNSEIEITGHTDIIGMEEHNLKFSEQNAKEVKYYIKRTKKGNFSKIESKGLGEDSPLYTNEIPEGRFYNRTVQIIIRTPLDNFVENGVE